MTIEEYATELKLPKIKEVYKEEIKIGNQLNQNTEDILLTLLTSEYESRLNNRISRRISEARFSQKKYLVNYDLNELSKELEVKIKELSNLDFIENKENIILIGNPGTGKTHLAIALGIEACSNNKKVLFISVPNLIIELKEAMSNSQIHNYKRKFEKYDLVILDELGYVSFDKTGSEILFNLLSNRNDKGSIIITSNLVFERWNEIFKDPILTSAMIDRLAHKSHILDLTGDSYRIKETAKWVEEKEK